jgi:hypothetical protein
MNTLFESEKPIGDPFANREDVWGAALIEGLLTDACGA